jgi:hypothetical protein
VATLFGLAASVAVLSACDSLLEVDLPGTVTEEAIKDLPGGAEVLVNSLIGQVECSYSRFVSGEATGNEDVYTQGDARGGFAEYHEYIGGGASCTSGGDNGYDWFDPLQTARYYGDEFFEVISDFDESDIVFDQFDTKAELLAVTQIYRAIPYVVLGEHLCEITFEDGPLQTPDQVLAVAEGHLDDAIARVQALPGGDMDLPYGITTSALQMAYGLRARTRWASGDLGGAEMDAMQVDEGFVAWVTRDADPGGAAQRENDLYVVFHTDVAEQRTPVANMRGPIDWWNPVGGRTNPVTGTDWPAVIPFTGYLYLAIDDANGRAIDASQNPITETSTVVGTAVPDTRVPIDSVEIDDSGVIDGIGQEKYTAVDQFIPLVNWEEMWLIMAEANTANAVTLVNDIRAAQTPPLPLVTYGPTGGEIEDMIIEERRRSLFLEGRFWSTKIQNTDKLWFPRSTEDLDENGNEIGGAVRMVMEDLEFERNSNIGYGDIATGCDPDQAPTFEPPSITSGA